MTYRVITATLKSRTAVHIGSGQGNDLTDALIRRDSQGRPFIPGTAIAGALRSLLTRLAPRLGFGHPCVVLAKDEKERKKSCNCAVCQLFGDINPSDREDTTSQSHASRIVVFNAYPNGNSSIPLALIRDGVGIDRVTGTAARAGSVKFDLEVLPAGTQFELRLELRDATDEDERLLAAGLAEWRAGRLWLGGRVARGLGAFELENLEYKSIPLETADDVLAYLKSDKPWEDVQGDTGWLDSKIREIAPTSEHRDVSGVAQNWVEITGILQAEGPLLTNDTMVAGMTGFDHAPLLARVGDWQHPALTGAGLRGVLRSHAERIARTLATYNASGKKDFLLKCPACDPNVRDNNKKRRLPLESCDSLLKKSGVSSTEIIGEERLCLACRLFGSTRRGSRLIVEDAPYAGDCPPTLKMLDFLAVDRFTGGGKDGAKFDALALWRPAFKLRIYLENPQEWELGWLALVLRDLEEGWLSVGFGAAKGFGQVELRDWRATFGYLTVEDLPSGLTPPQSPEKSGVFETMTAQGGTDTWRTVAQPWVKAFRDKVLEFNRPEDLKLREDSYFGKVDALYPVLKGGAL